MQHVQPYGKMLHGQMLKSAPSDYDRHVIAFRPISVTACSWSYDNMLCRTWWNLLFACYLAYLMLSITSSVLWHCWLGSRKGIRPVKNMGYGGGEHWLVRMEWCPAGWSVCLPLLISPCTIKSRSSLLAPAHPGGPGKRAIKRLWLWWFHHKNDSTLHCSGIQSWDLTWYHNQACFHHDQTTATCSCILYLQLSTIGFSEYSKQIKPPFMYAENLPQSVAQNAKISVHEEIHMVY